MRTVDKKSLTDGVDTKNWIEATKDMKISASLDYKSIFNNIEQIPVTDKETFFELLKQSTRPLSKEE